MQKRAFTLIEVIIVIIIIITLVGLALPKYQRSMEINKASVAVEQVKLIANMTQMLVENRTIPDCDLGCYAADINDNFDMDIHDPDFDYMVVCAPDSTNWSVMATRQGGSMVYTLTITSDDPGTIVCDPSEECSYINQ